MNTTESTIARTKSLPAWLSVRALPPKVTWYPAFRPSWPTLPRAAAMASPSVIFSRSRLALTEIWRIRL